MGKQLSAEKESTSSSMGFIKTIGSKDSIPAYIKCFGGFRTRKAYIHKASDFQIGNEIIDTLASIDLIISAEPLRITSNLAMYSYSEEIAEALPIKADDIAVKKLAELRNKKAVEFLWKRPDCNPSRKEVNYNSGLLAKFAVEDLIYDGKITEAYEMKGKEDGNEIYNNTLRFDFGLHGKFDAVRILGRNIYSEMKERNYDYIK